MPFLQVHRDDLQIGTVRFSENSTKLFVTQEEPPREPGPGNTHVTVFVTRRGWNGKEGTGMHRLNGTLQDLGIA
jgi:hypothetical protein